MTDNIESSGRTIPRLYIGTTIPKAEDARVILGADALEEQVQEELITITELRKKCMVWAKDRVKQIQFEEAFEEQGMEDVKRWEDIGCAWKEDGGEDNQKRLYHIMHGVFERETKWNGRSWQEVIEEEFMKNEKLCYTSRDMNPAGKSKRKRKEAATGIQRVIMSERNELNKLINGRSRMTHKLSINIKRIDGKRRKKDHFTKQYVSQHKMNETEAKKSQILKEIKTEASTIALNKENISALVKAQQKLNSSQANAITEKVKKKKPKEKNNAKKKGNERSKKKKGNNNESPNRDSPNKKSWMEKRRALNKKYHNKYFELSKIDTGEGQKGESRRSTTQTKFCITK